MVRYLVVLFLTCLSTQLLGQAQPAVDKPWSQVEVPVFEPNFNEDRSWLLAKTRLKNKNPFGIKSIRYDAFALDKDGKVLSRRSWILDEPAHAIAANGEHEYLLNLFEAKDFDFSLVTRARIEIVGCERIDVATQPETPTQPSSPDNVPTVDELIQLRALGYTDAQLLEEIERLAPGHRYPAEALERLRAAGFGETLLERLKPRPTDALAHAIALHGAGRDAASILAELVELPRVERGPAELLPALRAGLPASVLRALRGTPLRAAELIELASAAPNHQEVVLLARIVGLDFVVDVRVARQLLAAGVPSEVIASLRQKTTFDSTAVLAAAQMAYNQGDYAQALQHLDRILNADPSLVAALRLRGQTHFQIGKYAQSVDDLTAVLQREPNGSVDLAWRGSGRIETGDLKGALADLDQAIQLDSSIAWYFQKRAATRRLLDQLDAAKEDAQKAITLDPQDPVGYNQLALVHELRNELREAIAVLDQALQQQADFYWGWFNRGKLYHALGDKDSARRDFTRALELAGNDERRQACQDWLKACAP